MLTGGAAKKAAAVTDPGIARRRPMVRRIGADSRRRQVADPPSSPRGRLWPELVAEVLERRENPDGLDVLYGLA